MIRTLTDFDRAVVMRGPRCVGVYDLVGGSEDRDDLFASFLDLAFEIVKSRLRAAPGRHQTFAFVELNVVSPYEIVVLPCAGVADVACRAFIMFHERAIR